MLQTVAYDTFAPFIPAHLRVFNNNLDAIPRPLLFIVKHGGAVAEPIDLVSLDASIKVGQFLAQRLQDYHESDITASKTLCADSPVETNISHAEYDDAINGNNIIMPHGLRNTIIGCGLNHPFGMR